YLVDGYTRAEKGAVSVCVGRRALGRLPLKTVYISFDPPRVAAVKMVNSPPFFATWAATIRHEDLGPDRSRIRYTYHFTARPRWLRWLLEPIMSLVFARETKRRLELSAATSLAHAERQPIFSFPLARPNQFGQTASGPRIVDGEFAFPDD